MEPAVRLDLAIIDAAYGTDRDAQAYKMQQLESAIDNALQQGEGALTCACGRPRTGTDSVGASTFCECTIGCGEEACGGHEAIASSILLA